MGKGSWGEEKKEKVQGEGISRGRIGEMSSKELVKTRFFSTGHGVKLEGSMSYAKGRSWALLLSIYKWRRRSCGDSWSRAVSSKSEASRASAQPIQGLTFFSCIVPGVHTSFR